MLKSSGMWQTGCSLMRSFPWALPMPRCSSTTVSFWKISAVSRHATISNCPIHWNPASWVFALSMWKWKLVQEKPMFTLRPCLSWTSSMAGVNLSWLFRALPFVKVSARALKPCRNISWSIMARRLVSSCITPRTCRISIITARVLTSMSWLSIFRHSMHVAKMQDVSARSWTISAVVSLLMLSRQTVRLLFWTSHRKWVEKPHRKAWKSSIHCSAWTTLLRTNSTTILCMCWMLWMPIIKSWLSELK